MGTNPIDFEKVRVERQHRCACPRGGRIHKTLSTCQLAMSAFQDSNDAARFLANEHPELNNRVPLGVAPTEVGGREVEEVIEPGLHGLPA